MTKVAQNTQKKEVAQQNTQQSKTNPLQQTQFKTSLQRLKENAHETSATQFQSLQKKLAQTRTSSFAWSLKAQLRRKFEPFQAFACSVFAAVGVTCLNFALRPSSV
jgi:hypothetical protein